MTENSGESWQPHAKHRDLVEAQTTRSFDYLRMSESKTSNTCENTLQWQSWSLARAKRRLEQTLELCELPDSPPSSCYAPSTNECEEDDFDDGALINRVHQSMEPSNISKCTTHNTVQHHHHPPHTGPRKEINHGMADWRNSWWEPSTNFYGGKDEGINGLNHKECFISADMGTITRTKREK